MNHKEKARELFESGYNCAQAVFGAFCDVMQMDFETALRLSSSFGGGMGRLREVCGACSGMFMVAGMLYGYTDPEDREAKKRHYQLIQQMAEAFKEKNGSIVCREILAIRMKKAPDTVPEPAERTAAYYRVRPCVKCVEDAAQIMDEWLDKVSCGSQMK